MPFSSLRKSLEKRKDIDISRVEKAYHFARRAHAGQKRKSGEDYIIHPVSVAEMLADIQADEESIIAALLHDTVEDTSVTSKEIRKNFGEKIAELVDGLTKLAKIKYQGSVEDRTIDNFSRMIFSSAKDIRIILIKLLDRLHNLQTIQSLRPEKQKRIAQETMDIYIPIAQMLGAWKVMVRLEEICFEILEKTSFQKMTKYFENFEKKYGSSISHVRDIFEKKVGCPAFIFPRRKYSLFEASKKFLIPFSEIDLPMGVKIIVPTQSDCYKTLEIIHTTYPPRFDKIKDYIARPKENGYAAFHTGVFLKNGVCLDVQILSQKMESKARFGFFNFCKKGTSTLKVLDKIIDLQKNSENKKEFFETVKKGILHEKIYVFNEKGDMFELPKGSLVLDFAYAESEKGAPFCSGAFQNNISVSPFSELSSGDNIRIQKEKEPQISAKWLPLVQSQKGKQSIRMWIQKREQKKNKKEGEEILRKKLSWIHEEYNSPLFQDFFKHQDCSHKILENIGMQKYSEDNLLALFLLHKKEVKVAKNNHYCISFFLEQKKRDFLEIFSEYDLFLVSTKECQKKNRIRNKGILFSPDIENIFQAFEKISYDKNTISFSFSFL